MKAEWQRIERWLAANAPDVLEDLRAPASDDEIRSAEQRMQVALPEPVRELYRMHDGQAGDAGPLVGEWEFLPLSDAVRQWEIQKKLLDDGSFAKARAVARGPVRETWWNARWIPFAYDGAGNLQCFDLDPAPGGQVGQVVVYWHDREQRECRAASVFEWLQQLGTELETSSR